MKLNRIKDLYIAKNPFKISTDIVENIDYKKWIDYISNNDYYTWFEETKEGKEILTKIDLIPEDFKQSYVSILNKVRCVADFNLKKSNYEISLGFHKELKNISISLSRNVTVKDLRRFLDVAKQLDALLLKDGNQIIDEKTIESLK